MKITEDALKTLGWQNRRKTGYFRKDYTSKGYKLYISFTGSPDIWKLQIYNGIDLTSGIFISEIEQLEEAEKLVVSLVDEPFTITAEDLENSGWSSIDLTGFKDLNYENLWEKDIIENIRATIGGTKKYWVISVYIPTRQYRHFMSIRSVKNISSFIELILKTEFSLSTEKV